MSDSGLMEDRKELDPSDAMDEGGRRDVAVDDPHPEEETQVEVAVDDGGRRDCSVDEPNQSVSCDAVEGVGRMCVRKAEDGWWSSRAGERWGEVKFKLRGEKQAGDHLLNSVQLRDMLRDATHLHIVCHPDSSTPETFQFVVKSWADALQIHPTSVFEELLIRGSSSEAELMRILDAAKGGKLKSLKSLTWDCVRLNDKGVAALAEVIKAGEFPSLQKLSLPRNYFGDDGMAALGRCFAGTSTELSLLDLGWNHYEQSGIKSLAEALQSGALDSLKVLKLENNLAEEDFRPLVEVLSINHALTFDMIFGRHESKKGNLLFRGLHCQQSKVVEKNRKEVQHLGELGERMVAASLGKVYLCGNPEVGKTTLRKSLQRSYVRSLLTWETKDHVEPRTQGIDVCKITHKGTHAEQEISLMVWDMAGQDEYHLIHNAFFHDLAVGKGKATMFVVICTSWSLEKAKEELQYWFRFIASSVNLNIQNPRDVFVVVNRWNGDSFAAERGIEWEQMLSTLATKFEKHLNIKAQPFFADARKKSSVKPVQQALLERSREMLLEEEVPDICHFIQTHLSTWSQMRKQFPVLSWVEFDREIQNTGAKWPEKIIEDAVKYLNETGVLIHIHKDFPKEWRLPGKNLIVLDVNWFCNEVVGCMFLPRGSRKSGRLLFRSKVDPYTGSIPIAEFKDYFQFLVGTWENTKFDDLLAVLLWSGLCYKGSHDNIFIPSLIEKDKIQRGYCNADDLTKDAKDNEDQEVMEYFVEHARGEIALAPISLWHKFEVELAQTHRFNGQVPDNDFVAGKYFTTFKVDHMVVWVEVKVHEELPTFDRIEILVKPIFNKKVDLLDINKRKQHQFTLATDIAEILMDVWDRVCPGIGSARRVVWPWPTSHQRSMTKVKHQLDEVKKWVQEYGLGRMMRRPGDEDTVTEDQSLSIEDKEVVLNTIEAASSQPWQEMNEKLDTILAVVEETRDIALETRHIVRETQDVSVEVLESLLFR